MNGDNLATVTTNNNNMILTVVAIVSIIYCNV